MYRAPLLALFCALSLTSAKADPVADFYAGRTLSLTIGFAPGGGYDNVARLLARHLGSNLPGKPTIVVRNMPGAGGLVAANALYNLGPRDGTELAIFSDAIPFAPLWQTAGVQFDPTKFEYLGALDRREAGMVIAWRASGVTTFEDARKRTVTVGSTGPHDITAVAPRLLNATTGSKFRIVGGYRGIAEGALALERGEIDSWQGWCWPCIKDTKPQWLKDNRIAKLAQFGSTRHPELTDVPTVYELATNEEDRQIMRLVFSSENMSRFVVLGPGAPPERVAAMRKAFDDTVASESFRAEAARSRIPLLPATAQAAEALIRDAYATPPALLARARAIAHGN